MAFSLVTVAALAVACGGASTASGGASSAAPAPVTTSAASSAPASAPAGSSSSAAAVTLKTAKGSAGIWLTDSAGKTLYIYTVDKGTTSSCYSACATLWPPLLTNGTVNVASGGLLTAKDVGTTTRTDGTKQVTYGGHPLYYFQGDKAAGDIKGDGLQGVWFLLGPFGNVMKTK